MNSGNSPFEHLNVLLQNKITFAGNCSNKRPLSKTKHLLRAPMALNRINIIMTLQHL